MPYLLFLETAAKQLIVVCCKYKVALYGLISFLDFIKGSTFKKNAILAFLYETNDQIIKIAFLSIFFIRN